MIAYDLCELTVSGMPCCRHVDHDWPCLPLRCFIDGLGREWAWDPNRGRYRHDESSAELRGIPRPWGAPTSLGVPDDPAVIRGLIAVVTQ